MTDAPAPKPQIDKFRDAARELECDDDEAAFDERLKRLAHAKRPKPGSWRVDFAHPHGHRANFYPEGSDSWTSSPIFATPQEVYAWLAGLRCRQDEADPDRWYDQ